MPVSIDQLGQQAARVRAMTLGARRARLALRIQQDLLFYRTLHDGIGLTIRQLEELLATADRDPEPPGPEAALPPAA